MTLLIDRDRMGRHRTRCLASDVGVMGPIGHPGHVSGAEENRGDECQIVEVAAAFEGIIDCVLDTGNGLESGQARRHRLRHRPEVNRNVLCLGQHLAFGGEDGRRAIGPLLDVGRQRRVPEHRPHLVGHRGETMTGHLQAYGVWGHDQSRWPMCLVASR
jgi:hypothetical protein